MDVVERGSEGTSAEIFIEFPDKIKEIIDKDAVEILQFAEDQDRLYREWYKKGFLYSLTNNDEVQSYEPRTISETLLCYLENEPELYQNAEGIHDANFFNPGNERFADWEYFIGTSTIHPLGEFVDVDKMGPYDAKKVTEGLQQRFPEGVRVRVCFREPSKREKEELGYVNKATARTVFIFVSAN
jgi:hypothetical protein